MTRDRQRRRSAPVAAALQRPRRPQPAEPLRPIVEASAAASPADMRPRMAAQASPRQPMNKRHTTRRHLCSAAHVLMTLTSALPDTVGIYWCHARGLYAVDGGAHLRPLHCLQLLCRAGTALQHSREDAVSAFVHAGQSNSQQTQDCRAARSMAASDLRIRCRVSGLAFGPS